MKHFHQNKFALILFFCICLMGCQSVNPNLNQLARGKKYFKEQNYGMAFAQLLPLAKRGNADAEYAVGYMYYYGYGIKVDKQAALTWMRKAGAQNNVAAKQALAMIDTPMWNSKPGRSIH